MYEFIEMFMKNRFIDSADEDTVRAYEKSLGISEIADNIEVRKVLSKQDCAEHRLRQGQI